MTKVTSVLVYFNKFLSIQSQKQAKIPVSQELQSKKRLPNLLLLKWENSDKYKLFAKYRQVLNQVLHEIPYLLFYLSTFFSQHSLLPFLFQQISPLTNLSTCYYIFDKKWRYTKIMYKLKKQRLYLKQQRIKKRGFYAFFQKETCYAKGY